MYCPQCGQVQADEVRYCSRCGLWLQEVNMWLNGASESLMQQTNNRLISRRRQNIIRAAKVAFFTSFLLPVGFVVGKSQRELQWFAIPMMVFLGSLVWMLYSRLFIPNFPKATRQVKPVKMSDTNYLPPSRSAGVTLPPHRIDTSEIAQPPSITEYTTNLLPHREK